MCFFLGMASKEETPVPTKKLITQYGLDFNASTFDWNTVKSENLLYKCLDSNKCNPTSGAILAHAKEQVDNMQHHVGVGLCIFKIGVTANPLLRFASYLDLGYTTMWLINVSPSLGLTVMLEAALISEYGYSSGCKNKPNSGGEGAFNRSKPLKPPFFVYVVAGRADQPRWVG